MAKQNESAAVAPSAAANSGPSNLVKDGAIIATVAPMFGVIALSRGEMAVSDRYGRSVNAITARVPFAHTGLGAVIAVYGRLDDKTGKITYTPSLPAKVLFGDTDAKDALKAAIIGAVKVWPEWPATRKLADHACRFGKVKKTVKAADGTETIQETSLESEPEPVVPPVEQPATTL